MSHPAVSKPRFDYIDQFRGLVGILMLLGHCSYFFNSVWERLDPVDPVFESWGQFALRYVGYLCAPGFLMMSSVMTGWSYRQRIRKGASDRAARWQLIQRGLFLILVQVTWVNSSWGGFSEFKPGHIGIIACIGTSMILLTLVIRFHWMAKLGLALALLLIHPLLLKIQYDPSSTWQTVLMQTFVDAGEFNKYPVIPWFALGLLGSAMATGWLEAWKTGKQRIAWTAGIGILALILAIVVRLGNGFGNIFPFSGFGSFSFFIDQKYPPSLFMGLWFFGLVLLGICAFLALNKVVPKILWIFSTPGRVPLFFYGMHLAILGIFVKRMDLFYREGGILATMIGFVIMMIIMLPLCKWFYGVKCRSGNWLIRMI